MGDRYLADPIERIAFEQGKMALLSGPRQAGKTTLGRMLLAARESGRYSPRYCPRGSARC